MQYQVRNGRVFDTKRVDENGRDEFGWLSTPKIETYFEDDDGFPQPLTEKQQEIIRDIVEFDDVTDVYGRQAGIMCRLRSGRKVYIKLRHLYADYDVVDIKFTFQN